jgi:outer membrane protein assembly factor BamB
MPGPIPGYLLIADAANDRMLLVDSSKRIVWQFPRPGATPSFPIRYDDDAFFGPDHREIISNQEEGHTIVVVSFPEGRITWHYGHPDVAGSGPGYLNTPDDAYLLPDGTRTVADIKNCRILFISPGGRIVRQLGTTGVCAHDPPRSFGAPNGDTPMPGGATLVTEIYGSWIDAVSASGKLMWTVRAPVAYPSDAQWLGDGRILVADYSSPGAVVIMSTKGKVLWKYAPKSGEARLDHPSLALMLPNGLIAVNDDRRDRVVLISMKTHRIVWQYGHTDVPGTAPGYLHTPDGMDFLPFDVAMADPAIRAVVSKPR